AIAARGDVRYAVMGVAFLAVAPEGLEAALFLIAAATTQAGGAGPIGGLVVPMRQFFTLPGLVLIVFAAGLVSRTILWLQAAGELGTVWNNVYDLTAYPWLTVSTETGKFLGAMFGWAPRPSIEQIVGYLAYLGTVSWLFLRAPKAVRERQKVARAA